MDKITIIIPIFNGETTLRGVFGSLELQNNKELINEIIFINDASSDNSEQQIRDYQKTSSFITKIITHTYSLGLAASYNEGIQLARSKFVILMHQDIILSDGNSFSCSLFPFVDKDDVVISYPTLLHPKEIWDTYNFWQKCLFSRLVGKEIPKFTGKFDCINIQALSDIKFDHETYRTAGEDFDFEVRAKQVGLVIPNSVSIVHVHDRDPKFSLIKLLRKEAQLAECYGVNLRRHLNEIKLKDMVLMFFRPVLIVGLCVLHEAINLISFIFLLVFIFRYTQLVYRTNFWDPRILLLPAVTASSCIIYSYYFFKGIIYGRQRL